MSERIDLLNRINLKLILGRFFTLKPTDDKNRPVWITSKFEESYENGSWRVGK